MIIQCLQCGGLQISPPDEYVSGTRCSCQINSFQSSRVVELERELIATQAALGSTRAENTKLRDALKHTTDCFCSEIAAPGDNPINGQISMKTYTYNRALIAISQPITTDNSKRAQ